MERVGSGDSAATVVEIYTSGQKDKRYHMVGPYAHVNLYNNSPPYELSNLMISETSRSGILQEWTKKRAVMEDASRMVIDTEQIIQNPLPFHRRKLIAI